MKIIKLENIKCDLTAAEVLIKMGMPPDHRFAGDIAEAIEEAAAVANAKAIYGETQIDEVTDNGVIIEGIAFEGMGLAEKLKGVKTVYPYLCTCGKELDGLAWGCNDLVKMLYYDTINHFYLREAVKAVSAAVDNSIGTMSACITPGSDNVWELSQQQNLFRLLNDYAEIGVKLTDSFIMYPAKSVSGLRYIAPEDKRDCRLCLKSDCSRREAEFDGLFYDNSLC